MKVERKGDWMQTASGEQFWPLDPRASEVNPVDIAHHLSLICRYCGASKRFYSVAEHTLGVLHVGMREAIRRNPLAEFNRLLAVALLLHDASEAYCHDLIRPIKRNIIGYDAIEAANMRAIFLAFDIDPIDVTGFKSIVKDADNAMLLAEQDALMLPAPAKWAPVTVPAAMLDDAKRYMRRNRWQIWRQWSWWNKRAMLRAMRQLGLR